MPEINLSNEAGRDAVVNMENVTVPLQVRWIDPEGRQARNVRFLKSTINHDIESLQAVAKDSDVEVGELLIKHDADVDLERVGSMLFNTSRAYVNDENAILHRVVPYEVIRDPDGTERERRPAERSNPNVSGEIPLSWSGVFIKKSEAVSKFVFQNKLQLTHINGLTYDFLFEMASELDKRNSMLILGAGPKANQPLVLRRGSIPYRGFLEGRVQGEKYLLRLHLSNMELKSPAPLKTEGED